MPLAPVADVKICALEVDEQPHDKDVAVPHCPLQWPVVNVVIIIALEHVDARRVLEQNAHDLSRRVRSALALLARFAGEDKRCAKWVASAPVFGVGSVLAQGLDDGRVAGSDAELTRVPERVTHADARAAVK